MVLESSLTADSVSKGYPRAKKRKKSWFFVGGGPARRTVLQHLVEMLEVLHDDVAMLF